MDATAWVDKARPFLGRMVTNLQSSLTGPEIVAKLTAQKIDPKTFLADSLLNVLVATSKNAWTVQIGIDRARAFANGHLDEFIAEFGSIENALEALAQQDLTTLASLITGQ